MLYSTNTFVFPKAWLIPTFYASIPTAHWQKLRSVRIFLSPLRYHPHEARPMTSHGTNGSWHTIHPLISSLPNLSSCEIYTSLNLLFSDIRVVGPREIESIGQQLLDFFTTRRCRGKIRDLQVYIPVEIPRVEDIKEGDDSSDQRAVNLHHLSIVQRKLREKGVQCKVLPGGCCCPQVEHNSTPKWLLIH
jgi:hypothetical protein